MKSYKDQFYNIIDIGTEAKRYKDYVKPFSVDWLQATLDVYYYWHLGQAIGSLGTKPIFKTGKKWYLVKP
jgi:hypothetical protein